MPKFLFADDDQDLLCLYRKLIASRYKESTVICVSNGKEALKKIKKQDFNVIVTDLNMPGMGGIEFHEKIEKNHPHLANRIAIVSGYKDALPAPDFCDTLEKPYNINEFYGLIEKIIQRSKDC